MKTWQKYVGVVGVVLFFTCALLIQFPIGRVEIDQFLTGYFMGFITTFGSCLFWDWPAGKLTFGGADENAIGLVSVVPFVALTALASLYTAIAIMLIRDPLVLFSITLSGVIVQQGFYPLIKLNPIARA